MSSRTKWWLGMILTAALAAPLTARGQECGPQAGLGAMPNYGAPVTEWPLPLMWDARNEGPFFAMEAVAMRINNILGGQLVAQRGFWDDTGLARGDPTGPVLIVQDGRNANSQIALLLADAGTPGQFVGSGAPAMYVSDVNDASRFTPGTRLTAGWRLRNGLVFDVSYLQLVAARGKASVGIIPPRSESLRDDLANSFVSTPFFNYTPEFAGAQRDVISDVFLFPVPPNTGTVSLVNPGSATGAPNEIITDDASIDDIIAFRGTPIAAYGVGNAAEIIVASYRQQFNTGELNVRVPLFQGDVTRTYFTGGFRYAFLQERYRLYITDLDVEGNKFMMRYTDRIKNRYYGMQLGLGSEAYLGLGWSFSVEAKAGVAAENSLASTEIANLLNSSFHQEDNQFGVVGLFQGGAYIWWYPIEGVQLRFGYEYLGIVNARRSPNPLDYNLGSLSPTRERKYLSVDGVTVGVGFIF
jgi:hypothetical protein